MDIKERFYGKLNEAREQLDELRGKGTLDKKDKEKLQKRIRDKHDKAWDETQEIRKEKKSKGSEDTKHMDKFRNRLAKMHNKLDESSPEKIGRYISKASKQKKEIQDKAYADKLEKGDLSKFEKRKKGVQMGIKKLTGQSKVPAK